MAQYKVPQDVEADDKLLGPFSFRQFVYLLIAGGLIALAVGLFQLFPVLAIIPLPFILLFGALALPLKKDQPMETYLVAIVSYYLKPKNQLWTPGQRESTIEITAPKIVEAERTRNITGEEATHRLSFLADIVDTEGRAIKGTGFDHANSELAVEATNTRDMFETSNFNTLGSAIKQGESQRHDEVIQEMKNEIQRTENMAVNAAIEKKTTEKEEVSTAPNYNSPVVVAPSVPTQASVRQVSPAPVQEKSEKAETFSKNPSIIELANNSDYSVATIAKEANRIKERSEGEVFISLH